MKLFTKLEQYSRKREEERERKKIIQNFLLKAKEIQTKLFTVLNEGSMKFDYLFNLQSIMCDDAQLDTLLSDELCKKILSSLVLLYLHRYHAALSNRPDSLHFAYEFIENLNKEFIFIINILKKTNKLEEQRSIINKTFNLLKTRLEKKQWHDLEQLQLPDF